MKQRAHSSKAKGRPAQAKPKRSKKTPETPEKSEKKQVPKSIDTACPLDDAALLLNHDQGELSFNHDEFSSYFKSNAPPKIIVTTSKRASRETLLFAEELSGIFYNARAVKRGTSFEMTQVVSEAVQGNYTDIIVIGERLQVPYSLTMMHLPEGPTAHFKLSAIKSAKSIRNHGTPTEHPPELIMNRFSTMLGVGVGRFLMALFPQVPQFTGRQVVTFHHQRDYIFFRRHRYIFEAEGDKVRMQELGPRFTLKLEALQRGVYKKADAEFIWLRKKAMNTRKSFYL